MVMVMVMCMASAEADVTLQRIVIKDQGRLSHGAIEAMLPYRKGDSISQDDVENIRRALLQTQSFQSISVVLKGSILFITTQENPIINSVVFRGNKNIKASVLKAAIQLRVLSYYNEKDIKQATAIIASIYKQQGYSNATVTESPHRLSGNRVDVIFTVAENAITKVARIRFVGNHAFSSGALRDVLSMKEQAWWRFLTYSDVYEKNRIDADKSALITFYGNHGFLDMKVLSVNVKRSPNKSRVYITYTIKEGKRYKLGRIFIDASAITVPVDMKALNKQLVGGERNGYYYVNGLKDIVLNITKELIRQGHLFIAVAPKVARSVDAKGNAVVRVKFSLVDVKHVFVERIVIRGNTRTFDKVIRREMELVEGDPLNMLLMRNSVQNIRNLGFFSNVKVSFEKGSSDDQMVIYITVQEKSTGVMGFGVGYGSADGLLAKIYAKEDNFLGHGQKVNFSINKTAKNIGFSASITQPHFLGRKLSANAFLSNNYTQNGTDSSADSSKTIVSSDDYAYKTKKLSFGWGFSYNLNKRWYDSIQLSFDRHETYDIGSKVSQTIKDEAGVSYSFTASHKIIYSDLDDLLNPTRGIRFSALTAMRNVFSEYKNLFAEAKAAYFHPINDQISLSAAGSAAKIFDYDKVLLENRLYLNSNYVRGFEEVGPRDKVTGSLIGGTTRFAGIAELNFPIGFPKSMGVTGALFASAAKLYGTPPSKGIEVIGEKEWRSSVGFSLKWAAPIGSLRFDFSKILQKAPSDTTSFYQFNIGFGLL